ncbi:unnamed protein product [Closterium sp. NIES-54]
MAPSWVSAFAPCPHQPFHCTRSHCTSPHHPCCPRIPSPSTHPPRPIPHAQSPPPPLRTSAGTMGALTAVDASSPISAPTTASAISTATPSCASANGGVEGVEEEGE